MVSLRLHFKGLLKNIRPPSQRTKAAQTLPKPVQEYLRLHQEFITLFPHTRLVGSYAQDLSVGDVKDVDFLVRTDGDTLRLANSIDLSHKHKTDRDDQRQLVAGDQVGVAVGA